MGQASSDSSRRAASIDRMRQSPTESRLFALNLGGHVVNLSVTVAGLQRLMEGADFAKAQTLMDLLIGKFHELFRLRLLMIDIGWLTDDESVDENRVISSMKTVRDIFAHYEDYLLKAGRVRQDVRHDFGRYYRRGKDGMTVYFTNPSVEISLEDALELFQETASELLSALDETTFRAYGPSADEPWDDWDASTVVTGHSQLKPSSAATTYFSLGDTIESSQLHEASVKFSLLPSATEIETSSGLWVHCDGRTVDLKSVKSMEELLEGGGMWVPLLEVSFGGEIVARCDVIGRWIYFNAFFHEAFRYCADELDPQLATWDAIDRVAQMGWRPEDFHHPQLGIDVRAPFLEPQEQWESEEICLNFPHRHVDIRLNGVVVQRALPGTTVI